MVADQFDSLIALLVLSVKKANYNNNKFRRKKVFYTLTAGFIFQEPYEKTMPNYKNIKSDNITYAK